MFMLLCYSFFFFNDTATTEIYTLSLHDALPILLGFGARKARVNILRVVGVEMPTAGIGVSLPVELLAARLPNRADHQDRKSTRLNSSHGYISYAVFCLKKKNKPLLHSC